MTIEQLLECSADTLESMSDDELKKHFAPYLNVTRPELAAKIESNNSSGRRPLTERQIKALKAEAILKQYGIPGI